jgi:TRAP-type uncharacterized transport system substrate-binding protein
LNEEKEHDQTRSGAPIRVVQGILLLLVLLAGLRLVKESVPSELILFTGLEASAEYEFGQKYAEHLNARGLRTRVVVTAGAADNLQRILAEEQPAAGFSMSGVERAAPGGKAANGLVALASLYVEPAWLFMRDGLEYAELRRPDTGRISMGIAGSGATALADIFLTASGNPGRVAKVAIDDLPSGGIDQVLDRDRLDGVFALGTLDSELIEALMKTERLAPASIDRAAAFTRRYPFLVEVSVPEGSFALDRNLPAHDLSLLAPTIQLVARAGIQPAIVDLLLEAAQEIHREPTFFSERGAYPSLDHVSLPPDGSAIHFFEDGPPKLRKILPFWASTWIDRFSTFVATIFGALVAIFQVLPRLLGIPLQLKLKKWFTQLVGIEKESMAGGDLEALIDRLEALDRESANLLVFRFELTDYLEYRQHIFDTRDRLRLRQQNE